MIFSPKAVDAQIRFVSDKGGPARELILHQGGGRDQHGASG